MLCPKAVRNPKAVVVVVDKKTIAFAITPAGGSLYSTEITIKKDPSGTTVSMWCIFAFRTAFIV